MTEPLVKDIMQPVRTILRVGMSIRDAQRLLIERNVTGAPVVDAEGRIQGVVTRGSLIRHETESKTAGDVGEFFTDVENYRELEDAPGAASATRVEEAMIPGVVSISPDAGVAVAAECLRAHGVHRALVLDEDELVGVVSCHDLLALLSKPSGTETP